MSTSCGAVEGIDRQLLGWLTGSGRRVVVVLNGYCDESGREDGTFVAAGCLFTEANGEAFLREWNELFAPWGGCHWKELVHRKERFKDIDPEQRDQLIKRAVPLLVRWTEYGLAVVCNADAVAYMREWFDDMMTPYSVCCSFLVLSTATRLRRKQRKDRVNWTFESGHKDATAVNSFFSMVATSPQLCKEYRYAGHSFVPKNDCALLQAADFLAWEAGKFHAETMTRRGRADQRLARQSFASYWIQMRSRDAIGSNTLEIETLFEHQKYIAQNRWVAQIENLRRERGLPPESWPWDE